MSTPRSRLSLSCAEPRLEVHVPLLLRRRSKIFRGGPCQGALWQNVRPRETHRQHTWLARVDERRKEGSRIRKRRGRHRGAGLIRQKQAAKREKVTVTAKHSAPIRYTRYIATTCTRTCTRTCTCTCRAMSMSYSYSYSYACHT